MRCLIWVLLLTGITNTAFAQVEFKPYAEFGVKAGGSFSKMYLEDSATDVPFKGSLIGGRVVYLGQKNFGILFETNYSYLTRMDDAFGSLSYSYLSTPFLSRFRIPVGSTAIVINLGSYVQFIMHNDARVVLERNALMGLAGGLEFTFPIGRFNASLEGRYNYNLHSNSTSIDNLWATWAEVGLVFSYTSRKR
ncbi:MAG: hypothetical protein LC643_06815 [Bacteroidales bacterium]|nr:hypothetical protein [Bacteroidales bacterium]